jgi:hypothetical protein
MARIQTRINGISTQSSYTEGDCYSLVNLRPENGALHPVPGRKVITELSQEYDIVYVHQNSGYENRIGIKHNGGKSRVYGNIQATPELIAEYPKITSVQQIGNTLSLITGEGICYLLYAGETYMALGEIPEIEEIKYMIITDSQKASMSEYGSGRPSDMKEAVTGLFNLATERLYSDGFSDDYWVIPMKGEPGLVDAHLLVFAFRLYDGSTVKQTSPILLCPQSASEIKKFEGNYPLASPTVYVKASRVFLGFDTLYLEKWKDVVKSIDVFLSPGLGYNSTSNFTDSFPSEITLTISILKDQSSMIKNIEDCSSFYLIDSIPVGEKRLISDLDFSFPKKSKLDWLDMLTMKEELKADSFSHHSVTGEISFTYNRRLHLANIKNTLFGGFGFEKFQMADENTIFNGYKFDDYKQYKFGKVPGFPYVSIVIAVDIKTEHGVKTVYSRYSSGSTVGTSIETLYFWLNPYFSYPDSRAFKARFYCEAMPVMGSRVLIHEIDLTPSAYLNLSYHISTDSGKTAVMPPVPNRVDHITFENDCDLDDFLAKGEKDENGHYIITEIKPVTYTETGKLKVSELDNPFVFPNRNTYVIGNGSVLNLATIAIRIPEGSFGQSPLYVFTTNGIYALSVGTGDVLYASQSTPTSYEIPVKDIVCPTPFGVAFVSSRRICIISGQQVELLTPQLQPPQNLNIQSDAQLEGVVLNLPVNFTEFLKTIEHILYSPFKNELIMHDRDLGFGYVYCFGSRQFYQTTEQFNGVVQNAFPELLVIENRKIKDWSQSQSTDAHVSLVTRPLLFGTPDIKRLERMILWANLFNMQNPVEGKKSLLLNYYSMDEVNFRILRGIGLNPESRKDIDMGMFAKSKFRQFMLSFAGVLDEKSEIRFLETEIEKEYQNTKMR